MWDKQSYCRVAGGVKQKDLKTKFCSLVYFTRSLFNRTVIYKYPMN